MTRTGRLPEGSRPVSFAPGAAGQDVQTFVREALFEEVDRPRFGGLLAPVHEATRRRGLTVDDIDALADR